MNARIDTYLLSVGDPATRLDDTLARAEAFVAAVATLRDLDVAKVTVGARIALAAYSLAARAATERQRR